MLERASEYDIPILIASGASDIKEVVEAVAIIKRRTEKLY